MATFNMIRAWFLVTLLGVSASAGAADLDTPVLQRPEGAMRNALESNTMHMMVLKQDLAKVLQLFGEKAQVKIVIGKNVSGTIRNLDLNGNASTVLDQIAEQVRAIWWWNGTEIHFANRSEIASRNLKVRDVDALLRHAGQIGLPVSLLEVNRLAGAGMSQVTGPAALVAQLEQINDQLSGQLGVVSVLKYGRAQKRTTSN